ncbi:hypothetical protein B9Z19DRAFT_983781, partial [Tuber borchii]
STNLGIRRLSTTARIPTRGSALAAGYGFYSAHDATIIRRREVPVNTHTQLTIPAGTRTVASRSGLVTKNFIDVGARVIDADVYPPFILLFRQ